MVAQDQTFLAIKMGQQIPDIPRRSFHVDITKVVDFIIRLNDSVPVLCQYPIHLGGIRERAVAEFDDVTMVEMSIGDNPDTSVNPTD